MNEVKIKLYLASSSERRRVILNSRGINHSVLRLDYIESSRENDPQKYCEEIVVSKFQQATEYIKKTESISGPCFVLTADTLVACEGKIFGKPKSRLDAREMLKELSGKKHNVITSVYLGDLNNSDVFYNFTELTKIYFLDLNDIIIDNYLEKNTFWDKAGSYAIQGDECFFVNKLEGSMSNVVGLPIERLTEVLEKCIRGTLNCKKGIHASFY